MGIIDATYTGRIKVILHNLTQEPMTLSEGKSYCQVILLKNHAPGDLVQVNDIHLNSERGGQGFGSSNTNKVELAEQPPDLLDIANITLGAESATKQRIKFVTRTATNCPHPNEICQKRAEASLFALLTDLTAKDKWSLIDTYLSSQAEKIAQLNCELLSENQLNRESLAKLQYNDEFFGPIIDQLHQQKKFGLYKLQGGLLCTEKDGRTKLCTPSLLLVNLINHVHSKTGHSGASGTLRIFQEYFYHPRARDCTRKLTAACVTCKVNGSNTPSDRDYDKRTHTAEAPRDIISLDLITSLPSAREYTAILVFVDEYSGYTAGFPLKNTSAAQIYERLYDALAILGHIKIFRSDVDQRIISALKQLQKRNPFKIISSASYEHKQNGYAEAAVKLVKKKLSASIFNDSNPKLRTDWVDLLHVVTEAINCSIMKQCKRTRKQMFFNDKRTGLFGTTVDEIITDLQSQDTEIDLNEEKKTRTTNKNKQTKMTPLELESLVTVVHEQPNVPGVTSALLPKNKLDLFRVEKRVNDKTYQVRSLTTSTAHIVPRRKLEQVSLENYLAITNTNILAPETLTMVRTQKPGDNKGGTRLFDFIPLENVENEEMFVQPNPIIKQTENHSTDGTKPDATNNKDDLEESLGTSNEPHQVVDEIMEEKLDKEKNKKIQKERSIWREGIKGRPPAAPDTDQRRTRSGNSY